MKKKGLKKSIWFLLALLLLLVTVSYAWFFADTVMEGKTLDFEYDLSIIDPEQLSCEIWIPDGNDGYKKVEDFGEVLKDGMVPNQTASFKIRLYNNSESAQRASLALSGIKLSIDPHPTIVTDLPAAEISAEEKKACAQALLNSMFFGCRSVGGVYDRGNVTRPGNAYIRFSDAAYDPANDAYTLIIMDDIYFPPTQKFSDPEMEDEYAELNCYIYFDRNAGEDVNLMEMVMDMHELEIIR